MRASGILLGIASLPGEYGIGKLGKEARKFVDFLVSAKQHYWQILPLSPTGYGDSPYQSASIHAGNPYFIDLETLEAEGLLKPEEYKNVQFGDHEQYINYGMIYNTVFDVLRIAYSRFKPDINYHLFLDKNGNWVYDYALFMALKNENGGKPWNVWENDLKFAYPAALEAAKVRLKNDIGFHVFLQYQFFKQWFELKKYANDCGIEIIGDMPIYCAYDSVEAWLHPELFELDESKNPKNVAGCPPDDYALDGQLWGNPLYNWADMEQNGYKWWIDRIGFATEIYDVLRIDHFRGFAGFFSIPAKDKTAVNGVWRDGPGMKLFNSTNYWLGKKQIIAEDLGFVTEDVKQLLSDTGYPGMKVLQFAFDPKADSDYLPCNYKTSSCVVYTSTHDSDTLYGWAENLDGEPLDFCMDYCGIADRKDIPKALLRLAWSSVADIAIAQPQDILGLGNEARINIPSTVGTNWRWRVKAGDLTEDAAQKLAKLSTIYNRVILSEEESEEDNEETEN